MNDENKHRINFALNQLAMQVTRKRKDRTKKRKLAKKNARQNRQRGKK